MLASSDAAALASSVKEEEEDEEFSPEPVVLDGIKITLYAKAGVLPNDAELLVSKVESNLEEKITEAIDEETGSDVTVEKTYSYDINIYSESEGDFVQPEDGTVRVTFEEISEASDEDIQLSVYHVKESDEEIEYVEEVASGEKNSSETEISFDAEHFSIYAIVFTKKVDDSASEKVGAITIVPVDEKGNKISITNIGLTTVTFDSTSELKPKDVALDLSSADYSFKYAYVDINGKKAEVDKFVSSESGQKTTIVFKDSSVSPITVEWTYDAANMEKLINGKHNKGANEAATKAEIPNVYFVYKDGGSEDKDTVLVYFYVLKDGASLPTGSTGQDTRNYLPDDGSHFDTNDKWLGRAVKLENIDSSAKDSNNNIWNLDDNGNLISETSITQYIKTVPTSDINAYFKSKEDFDCFSEEDISWYVYKKQVDAYHIDGYINTSVTYDANYTGSEEPQTFKLRYKTKHTIYDYNGVFKESREGYTFLGWSLDKEATSPDKNYGIAERKEISKKITLYAVWQKDGVFDANIEVWAQDQTWYYDGAEHTNSVIDKQTSSDSKYVVTSIKTSGKVKNVSDTSNLNNKITELTIKDKTTNKEYTFNVDGTNNEVTLNGEKTKITVHNSTLTIKPRNVTLSSKSLSKKFDGTYLTADERYKAGEKNARDITASAYNETRGEGFVKGEGIDADKTEFTGKLLAIKKVEKGNTFNYTLSNGTLEENYDIERVYGDLEITPPDEKFKIKISLKASADGTGRDTYVIYNGTTQQAIMEVHVDVSGDIDSETLLQKIIEALKNSASNILSAGTLVAYAADEPGAVTKVAKQTVSIGGLDITVDGLTVRGGAGVDVGHYPIILDFSGMTIDTIINGEKIDLTQVVEIEIDSIAGETEKYNVNPEVKTDEEIIGWLHVSEREVTMLSDSASKQYDGTALTAKHVSETAYEEDTNKGFVPGEGAEYDITGSLVGSSSETQTAENTYTYTLKSNTKATNYKITTNYGTLTVTPLGGGGSTDPDPDPNPSSDPPTTTSVVPSSPVAAVLGARREAVSDGAAVLGARRAGTEDTTRDGLRVLVVVLAAGAAISLLFFGKKKEKEEL